MKFHFCGDQDCPDWFLTQIITLSRLSSVKTKLLAQHIARQFMANQWQHEQLTALVGDAKLSQDDVKSLLATVKFILCSASRFRTSEEHLCAELQQLGLPREHASAIAKVYQDTCTAIRSKLKSDALKVNWLEDVTFELVNTEESQQNRRMRLDLTVRTVDRSDTNLIRLTSDPNKLQVLLYELTQARRIIDRYTVNGL
nr:EOG090X0HLW [Cyclestheria hislopi]